MSKREAFWQQLPWDGSNNLVWPSEEPLRAELVKAILGARIIGAVEAVLEERLAIAAGKPPDAGQPDYESEAQCREVFANMSDRQRQEVHRLLKDACFSTLYWVLVKLKDYPGADVDIIVTPFQADGTELPPIGVKEAELFHHYFPWVERFSDLGGK